MTCPVELLTGSVLSYGLYGFVGLPCSPTVFLGHGYRFLSSFPLSACLYSVRGANRILCTCPVSPLWPLWPWLKNTFFDAGNFRRILPFFFLFFFQDSIFPLTPPTFTRSFFFPVPSPAPMKLLFSLLACFCIFKTLLAVHNLFG